VPPISHTAQQNAPVTFGIAALLLIAFFVAEGRLRRGSDARSLDAGPADQGTTRRIGITFGLNCLLVLLSPLLSGVVGALPIPVAWIGIAAMVAGIALRTWSVLVLGRFFTRTLRLAPGQAIVRAGPYRLVRHPGYSGDIAMWIGAGLAGGNAISALVISIATLVSYRRRIDAEERMLLEAFGDAYRDYAQRTWRLLPPAY
jgi:protein-S-isoprenylcysteine O-methyltransferase Ste14